MHWRVVFLDWIPPTSVGRDPEAGRWLMALSPVPEDVLTRIKSELRRHYLVFYLFCNDTLFLMIDFAASLPVAHEACRLYPPVTASTSMISPPKKSAG